MEQIITVIKDGKKTTRIGGCRTFTLAQEVYWIDYLKLKEILDTMNTTSVSRTSEFVKGVIDSRGKLISFDDNEGF